MKKYHRYYSILKLKCPRCGQGDLFERKGLIVYRNKLGMPECCPVCNQKYEIEPGFWIGALWTSYPIVVLIEVPFLMMALFSETLGPWIPLSLMFVAFYFAYPIMLRLGRSIWIHNWIRYDEELVAKIRGKS
ncbi:MAG: DUF983 domain-containing protein [Bacteroidetes bacterium]|nr:DUF983 domain-containing protein [Bacteroidota bacterium]